MFSYLIEIIFINNWYLSLSKYLLIFEEIWIGKVKTLQTKQKVIYLS